MNEEGLQIRYLDAQVLHSEAVALWEGGAEEVVEFVLLTIRTIAKSSLIKHSKK